ncbi:hypothetical protein T069G_06166 [Trichoderma breve]|uniref:Uncharacterized protein n=1 Tax=Trichoderma breve TaxID=2034170 RepID=A0A9W9BJV1_9HYPO|nr:hypothetical protein T069G_06166 [Trichoderma breve]KAJ4861178.1 hypothetical protein T069G_06166 [Trichoderma breve]
MGPFYLISILFISLGTAIPIIPRDNNGIIDGLLAIVKDATGVDLTPHDAGVLGSVNGAIGGLLNDGPKSILTILAGAEPVFDEVKSVLGIQDPRSLEEIVVSLKEAGNENFDQICQLLDTFRREHKDPAGGTIDSLSVGNMPSLDLTSFIDSMINLVGLQCPSGAAADRNM